MKVGTRLLLLSTFSAAVALSGWFVNHWSAARLDEAMTQLDYANKVQRAVTSLTTRFGLYQSFHDQDALKDWKEAHERLTRTLSQNAWISDRYIHSISRQNTTLQALTPLLGEHNHQSPGQMQLAYRIYASLQEMTEDAIPLATLAQQRIADTTEQGRMMSQGLMITLSLVLTLIAFQIAHSLQSRLERIRTQLQQVVAGNLFLSINDQRNDELGELARGFDSMLKRLRTTTFSVDQLNDEVHRHTATLKNQQEYLRTLIEAEPAGVITLDADSRILSINNAGARILHTPVQQAQGQSFCEHFVALEDRSAFANLVQSAFAGLSKNLQYRLQQETGDKDIWLQTYAVPFIDQHGTIISIITVSHDITGRVQEEQHLREARGFLQNVVDSVHDAMVVRDINFNIRLLNRAARDSEARHPCNQLQYPDTCATQHDGAARRLLRGSARETEIFTFTDSNGNTRHIQLEATALNLPDGTLNGVIEIYRDISENTRLLEQLHEEQARLHQLAHHDQLTGLPNRTLFLDRLEQVRLQAQRNRASFALLFIDLDRFKEINDTLGHHVGDAVLREVSRRLSCCIRASDTLARMGGDEFTIIMSPLPDSDDAAVLAQKLIDCIAPPYLLGEQQLFITTSIGISIYPQDGNSADTLIKNADAAMYKAKEDGKNIFRLYSAQLTERAKEHLAQAADLRRALVDDQICVHYQTRFDLATLTPIGLEALARWNHSTQGLIPADRFLPVAEGGNLIQQLGDRVIERVVRQARQWRDQGVDPGVIAINLSERQLHNQGLINWLRQTLDNHNCDPSWFELEVSEGALMASPEQANALFEKLHKLGFELAIDNFGSAFSSLPSLQRMPLTRLIIDHAFTPGRPGSEQGQGVCSAVIALAKSLDLKVCAQGIETPEQTRLLLQAGCTEVQGYLYCRPQPVESITELLKQNKSCYIPALLT